MKIKKEGKEVEIECGNPTKGEVKKGLKLLLASQKGEGNLGKIDEYMDYIDEITSKHTGLTSEELDNLDSEEGEKLVGYYNRKVRDKIDFLMSSLKSGSLEQKETPK